MPSSGRKVEHGSVMGEEMLRKESKVCFRCQKVARRDVCVPYAKIR